MWRLLPEPVPPNPLPGRTDGVTLLRSPSNSHVWLPARDIHKMLKSHLQSEQADLAEIAAKVTEVLADLILTAPDEQSVMMADVLANLGGAVRQKNEEDADPTNPRRRH
jgi:hypothetical protein